MFCTVEYEFDDFESHFSFLAVPVNVIPTPEGETTLKFHISHDPGEDRRGEPLPAAYILVPSYSQYIQRAIQRH